jgi:2-methylcitrate dehydratase PrpD
MPRIVMRVDPALDGVGPPLTEARVTVTLRDGRVVRHDAHGARGYPERPASDDELAAKFLSCATRALPQADAHRALDLLRAIEHLDDVRKLTAVLQACATTERGLASRS